jgi:hypothetical protein
MAVAKVSDSRVAADRRGEKSVVSNDKEKLLNIEIFSLITWY